jgi:hypothetical protein
MLEMIKGLKIFEKSTFLRKSIESFRRKMYDMAKDKELFDPEVVKISQL